MARKSTQCQMHATSARSECAMIATKGDAELFTLTMETTQSISVAYVNFVSTEMTGGPIFHQTTMDHVWNVETQRRVLTKIQEQLSVRYAHITLGPDALFVSMAQMNTKMPENLMFAFIAGRNSQKNTIWIAQISCSRHWTKEQMDSSNMCQ